MKGIDLVPFGDAYLNEPVGKLKVQESSYLPTGNFKIVDQGKSLIAGFSNDVAYVKGEPPYILFGDHTKVVKYIDFPFVVGADGVRLYKASKEFDPLYLFYFLKSASLPTDGYGRHSKYLDDLLIPKYKLTDQQAIASQLKEQFAEIEKAREAVEVQKKEVKRLKTLIREEVFIEVIEKYGRTHSLKEVCTISAGGTPSRGNASFFSGNIPWVKTLDLNFGIVTDTQEKISKDAFKSIRGEMLPTGTVLVAMYGGAGTIGKSGILGIEACTNQAICAMQPDASLLNYNYLHEWLCYIRPEWMQYSSGNRKDPNINKAVVEAMTIPLPPVEEQELFAKTISEVQSRAIALEAAILKQSEEIAALPKKLLEDAFNDLENG